MSGFMKRGFGDKEMMCYNKNPIMDNYGNITKVSCKMDLTNHLFDILDSSLKSMLN